MKWSVTLTDRLGPEMLTVLEIKGQVLHRVRLHVKVPGLPQPRLRDDCVTCLSFYRFLIETPCLRIGQYLRNHCSKMSNVSSCERRYSLAPDLDTSLFTYS